MRSGKKGSSKIIRLVIAAVVICVAGYIGYTIYSGTRGDREAKNVIKSLERIIPGLGQESDMATGLGRDPLASVSIDDIDIVGVLEIPSLDIMAPVTSKAQDEVEYFTKWLDGSPVKGNFKVLGGRNDVFRKLAKLKPGDRVAFTDVDGVRYMYEVMTQYHLKKWDKGDNELLLCYESDNDTYFVVGCTMIMGK